MDLLERKTYRHFPFSQYAWTEISFVQISLFAFVSGCPSLNAQPNNQQPLGPIHFPFQKSSVFRDLKILYGDDNIGYVCVERPFRKVRRLQPRSFGHKCASAMIQLSKGYDQSKIPSRKGNFFDMIGISSGKKGNP